MKDRSLSVLLLTLTLIIGMLGTLGFLTAAPGNNVVSIIPQSTVWSEPTNAILDTFTLNVTIFNATTLNTWDVILGWDPSILEVTGTTMGDFEALVIDAGGTLALNFDPTINNTAGTFDTAALQAAAGGLEITAPEITLLQVTFKAKDYAFPSATPIEILLIELFDGVPDPITPDAVVNGTFEFSPSANVAPVADFDWSPTFPTASVDLVTFDGSASSDPDGIGIANMTFDFGSVDAIPTTAVLTSAPWTVDVNYTVAGTFTVSLTVWDLGKPGFYPPDSDVTTKDITVLPAAAPSDVDVFTIKSWLGNTTLYRERGIGPLTPGSAFAPGETVTLRTYAYYEDYPVMDVNVAFQVNKPGGALFASLSAITDMTGHATVSVRLPQAPKPTFGNYEVTSTARFFETDFSDTLEFNVGWIIEITAATVSPDPVAKEALATITVDITNYDPHDAYPVVLMVSFFDKVDQILGTNSSVLSIPSGGGIYTLDLTIPNYAWPGPLAYANANAYTDYPALGGTAYCPEITDLFTIS